MNNFLHSTDALCIEYLNLKKKKGYTAQKILNRSKSQNYELTCHEKHF